MKKLIHIKIKGEKGKKKTEKEIRIVNYQEWALVIIAILFICATIFGVIVLNH